MFDRTFLASKTFIEKNPSHYKISKKKKSSIKEKKMLATKLSSYFLKPKQFKFKINQNQNFHFHSKECWQIFKKFFANKKVFSMSVALKL